MTIRKPWLDLNDLTSMKREACCLISLELARSWAMLSHESSSGDSLGVDRWLR
jgi:hypothetical protein